MLAATDHNFGDTNLPGTAKRLVQNCISFLAAFLRFEKIRPVEKLRIDLLQIHEIGDVDRMRRLDLYFFKVLVLQNNVTTTLIFETFDDLLGWNFFRIGLCHLFVPDRTQIAGAELSEAKLF